MSQIPHIGKSKEEMEEGKKKKTISKECIVSGKVETQG